eukprot:gene17841-biopygen8363
MSAGSHLCIWMMSLSAGRSRGGCEEQVGVSAHFLQQPSLRQCAPWGWHTLQTACPLRSARVWQAKSSSQHVHKGKPGRCLASFQANTEFTKYLPCPQGGLGRGAVEAEAGAEAEAGGGRGWGG